MRQNQQQQTIDTPGNAPGNYFGYGPMGWTRKDPFIEDAICTRMAQNRALDASGIQVEVQDGNVTLSGYVPTQGQRRLAHSLVHEVFGVKQINDHLGLGVAASEPATSAGAGGGRGSRS